MLKVTKASKWKTPNSALGHLTPEPALLTTALLKIDAAGKIRGSRESPGPTWVKITVCSPQQQRGGKMGKKGEGN